MGQLFPLSLFPPVISRLSNNTAVSVFPRRSKSTLLLMNMAGWAGLDVLSFLNPERAEGFKTGGSFFV